jgi:hypothetical protein
MAVCYERRIRVFFTMAMLPFVALLTLVSVATGAIPDCSYSITPCSCTGSCTSITCGITVAEGGSKWTSNLHFTFGDGSRKYCDVSISGRYSYSGSEVTQIPIGTPTVSGDSSCRGVPGSEVTLNYTVENNGVVSMTSRTTQATLRFFPDACPLSIGAGIAIGVSVLVSVLGVLLGFVCWRRKRARMTERGGQMISAPTYDMGLNEAFISAAQPSSQPPVVAVKMPATTPASASQAPIINTIPTTSPVFGADGKPIIINTIPTTTPVFGADGKPVFHNHVVLDLD